MKNTQIIKKADLKVLYKEVCPDWQKVIAELILFQDGNSIEVENEVIERAYSQANNDQKKLLNKYFKLESEDLFSVTTYKEVCNRLKIKELTIKDFTSFGEDALQMFTFHRIKNLERFFNGSWKANWANKSQSKWYPYFTVNNSSGALFFGGCYYDVDGFCGSVGYYKDEKTAKHIGTNFIDIYEDLKK